MANSKLILTGRIVALSLLPAVLLEIFKIIRPADLLYLFLSNLSVVLASRLLWGKN